MFGILEAVVMPHAGVFSTYEDLFLELSKRAEKEGYKIVKARSHRAKTGGADVPGNEIIRCDLVCDRGGRPYICTATKHRTSTKKTDCPWKAKAVHRKAAGGWLLTISCDQHNHEPGTPEPPSPSPPAVDLGGDDDDGNGDLPNQEEVGPRPDADTSAALQMAGVPDSALRLTGDIFHQFKTDYRKMPHAERLSALAHLQLRIAAIYAVQNEDMQRQRRQDAMDKRHKELDANRKRPGDQTRNSKRQRSQLDRSQPAMASTSNSQQQSSHIAIPDTSRSHAPQAIMDEPHFALHQSNGSLISAELPQFDHYPGPSKRLRGQQ